MLKLPKQSGQSLVEVLVALMIAGVVLTSLAMIVISSLKNAQFAQNQIKATKYAQEAIDKIRANRDQNNDIQYGSCSPADSSFAGLLSGTFCGPCFFKFRSASPLLLQQIGNCSGGGSGPSPTPITGDESFQMRIKMNNSTLGEAIVTVEVIWSDASGSHQSSLQTILTNF